MITQQNILEFCNNNNYDIRKSGNGRWIDQKCASDVLTVVADCIYNYEIEHPSSTFTTPDIWHYKYTIENVEVIFKKPGVENQAAKNEYDKFFQQPMELFATAGVLIKGKKGNRNLYTVGNFEILEYIALREKNALFFLKTYIEKTLSDSGIIKYFDDFFLTPNKSSYKDIKKLFSDFTIMNTKINGEVECNRIFNKVLNPLAYFKNSYGTERGYMSKDKITYDMLMYNRNNFRDVYADKPKGTTRKEYLIEHSVNVNDAYYKYQSVKAKNYLRKFNHYYRNGITEHIEERHVEDKATNMHHIFPEAEFQDISAYLENLIALTPTQHYNYAHPNANTKEISEQYQHLLLLSKASRIEDNLLSQNVEKIYDFYNFLFVLNVGFDNENVLKISDLDFSSVVNAINLHYIA